MSTQPDADTRLEVAPVGGAVAATIIWTVIAFFAGVAVFNLMNARALSMLEVAGSILWLCIVAFMLTAALVDAGGVGPLLVTTLGMFSRRAFIEVWRPTEGAPLLRYGFELLGRPFCYFHSGLDRVGMVNWHAGQASGMSGRDLDDWTVSVWCRPDDDAEGAWNRGDLSGKTVHIVGPGQARRDADALGRAVVAMLCAAGIRLAKAERDNEFVVVHEDGADGTRGRSTGDGDRSPVESI